MERRKLKMLECVSICPLIDPSPVQDRTSGFQGVEKPLHLAKWSPVGCGNKVGASEPGRSS